jgi:hypothetical protein
MRKLPLLVLCAVTAVSLHAQLTPDERLQDFQNLAALFAKRYAPYDWKKQALGFDLFNLKPWLDKINSVKDDLGFYEIEAQYVAQLNDVHTGFQMTSSFVANLGFTVDIYDGKVLIDGINRAVLPAGTYPFAIGDELVSLDGKAAEDWIKLIAQFRQRANPSNTRRAAAGQISVRTQAVFPRAVEIGDTATAVIRRASGDLETYTISWTKTGVPVKLAGPVPEPRSVGGKPDEASLKPKYLPGTDEPYKWMLPATDVLVNVIPGLSDTEEGQSRGYIIGYGSRTPVFARGFPASFVLRLGRSPFDFHFSGIYQANGLNIGYLRIPNFSPASRAGAVLELDAEISYLQDHTDGLVLDVTRNNGGGCYMLDVAARLIPAPFYFFGEEVRATQDRVNLLEAQLEQAKAANADPWIITTYQYYLDLETGALNSNRGLTIPIAACTQFGSNWAPVTDGNPPAANVYTKPMIVLIDEFSTSAAEIFAAMVQDNGRAPLTGSRSNGGGGSVSSWPTGFYSESISTNTDTLVIRKTPISSPDFPTAPYVENIGAIPDITIEYMTRDNLLSGGATYVQQFTGAILQQIQTQ